MFTTETRNDALETLELRDTEAKSLLVLAPSRGGMATRLALGGRHRFFLDEATLRDPTKNVRGGSPVLFPSPGKLAGDAWKHGTLKQHGFARNLPWEIVLRGTDGAATATLRLASNEVTRASYPWDFVADFTYALRGLALRIEQRFTNASAEPMPFGAGFHPYFHIKSSEKAGARIRTKATRAFDNVTKKETTIGTPETPRIDLTQKEVNLHLLDHGSEPCSLEWPGGGIVVRGSAEYTHWVVWTLDNKDFVCVEPWTCPGDALNTGDRVITLAPKETRTLWVEYAALPA